MRMLANFDFLIEEAMRQIFLINEIARKSFFIFFSWYSKNVYVAWNLSGQS